MNKQDKDLDDKLIAINKKLYIIFKKLKENDIRTFNAGVKELEFLNNLKEKMDECKRILLK